MKANSAPFDVHEVLHDLKHYLPEQAPLKDFIHHNTLHAFQNLKFFDALNHAAEMFGYKVSLTLEEYREYYAAGKIDHAILTRLISASKPADHQEEWFNRLIYKEYSQSRSPRIGQLRANWKKHYRIDLDGLVHPVLFRVLCSYLDQGISTWNFPVHGKGFLESMVELERSSSTSIFYSKKGRELLLNGKHEIEDLLGVLVGDESLYRQYLFDQQFAHQGWSGMVSAVENLPQTLLDRKEISIRDLIIFELILEIDALESLMGDRLKPLGKVIGSHPSDLFGSVPMTDLREVLCLWQIAFEWTFYDEVLAGLTRKRLPVLESPKKSFQAMFCIDDRECSLRRYLEQQDPNCETFGTPGFFGVEFFFQPEHGKFYTKLCPAPVTPQYLIKELETKGKREKDIHFTKHTQTWYSGWFISQTIGFWSAVKLFINIFRPTMSPATASSFKHMDQYSKLTIENQSPDDRENNLQIGFTIPEMAVRVENLMKSIGLVKDFAPLVYVVGHGSSSVNNPHFAAYDCGACSGRAGSVNSRTICFMANHPKVREILASKGILIPESTQFVGGLHDTTRDEVVFFDEDSLTEANSIGHQSNKKNFELALDLNAKERSRRFVSIGTHRPAARIHDQIRTRSVSLFEPRPELNHATNTLCIVGSRNLTKNLFLDRRAFLNSYDHSIDPEGNLLLGIIRPLGPVCGGINLEYFFSRVDNQKLGAGSKLPHNVMGLFGVANGIDGDLRPGLPSQMIEVHDPIRLLIIVEHYPDIVLQTIQKQPETYEWFINEWVNLVAINPKTRELFVFREGRFEVYNCLKNSIPVATDLNQILETHSENLPVYALD